MNFTGCITHLSVGAGARQNPLFIPHVFVAERPPPLLAFRQAHFGCLVSLAGFEAWINNPSDGMNKTEGWMNQAEAWMNISRDRPFRPRTE